MRSIHELAAKAPVLIDPKRNRPTALKIKDAVNELFIALNLDLNFGGLVKIKGGDDVVTFIDKSRAHGQ